MGEESHTDRAKDKVSWEGSNIYSWLQKDFLDKAFSDLEKQAISGDLSILTRAEVERYLPNPEDRVARAYTDAKDKGEIWWLKTDIFTHTYESTSPRSNGYVHVEKKSSLANYGVSSGGNIDSWSIGASLGIRPVIWVDLTKIDDIV